MSLKISTATNPCLARWEANPNYANWLNGVLSSDEGRLLLGVLSEMSKPTEDFDSIAKTTGDVAQKMALNHCLVSGHNLCLSNLRSLTETHTELEELSTESQWIEVDKA